MNFIHSPEDHDDMTMYRHEETGEVVDAWSLFNLLNHRWWDGEPVKTETGKAWRITSPEDKRGVWRKTDAESESESEFESESGSDS